jgi:hypothetical protein
VLYIREGVAAEQQKLLPCGVGENRLLEIETDVDSVAEAVFVQRF